jgi:anti-sigma factor RsiW
MEAPPTPHPTEQTLNAYGLGKLDHRLAEEVDRHLATCADCRRRAAGVSSDSFVRRLREARQAGEPTSAVATSGGSPAAGSPVPGPMPAAAPPPAESLPTGLGAHPDYQILGELGRGGMGVVYLAHNTLMGRDEVLKVMGGRS